MFLKVYLSTIALLIPISMSYITFVPRTAVKNNFRLLTSWHQQLLLWWRGAKMLSFCISARLSINMCEDSVGYHFCSIANICLTICWVHCRPIYRPFVSQSEGIHLLIRKCDNERGGWDSAEWLTQSTRTSRKRLRLREEKNVVKKDYKPTHTAAAIQ